MLEKVEKTEIDLGNGNKILLLKYVGENDVVKYLDNIVRHYVQNESYSEFIDMDMNNPWVRIVVKGKKSKTLFL